MLRLTAKSTQFERKTFTSWLIESAGTVPIHRRKDFDGPIDNTEAMVSLVEVGSRCIFVCCARGDTFQALEAGDAVMMFPEGMSRFHPTIAPLKTGGESG
jgi:glycerol-3-phosphate O-acyltransferase/dihydroxyacetone phosphate acyltransferase